MKKRQQGILTVEASIVLTFCLLFMLFLFSFARVYSAQTMVSHAVLQSSDAVALESYLREATFNGSEADVTELANRLMKTTSISAENYKSLRSADIPKIAKEKFALAIDSDKQKANEKLKRLGIKDGLDGIDFSASKMDLGKDDVIIYATYTVKMQFSVLGMNEITFTKAAKSKTFGDILFNIETIPQKEIMGSASGGGNYKYGTEIQISATPNYGYKFKKWADGNTDNPRIVTVTDAKTYVAVFEESEFGVNLKASPTAGGQVTGAGIYKYLDTATITATPSTGYSFSNWSIYKNKDGKTITSNTASTAITIDQSYTCTANFKKNSYTVKVKCDGVDNGNANIVFGNRTYNSLTKPYETSFKLTASTPNGYRFIGWKKEGTNYYFTTSATLNMQVPAENVTYIACYESLSRTVTFYVGNSVYATRTVLAGNSIGSNMPTNPRQLGSIFNGWSNFNKNTKVYNNLSVYGSWRTCTNHRDGRCGVDHYFNQSYPLYRASNGSYHYSNRGQCIVCADCGIGAYNGRGECTWDGRLTYEFGLHNVMVGQYCFQHGESWWHIPIYPVHG